MPLKDAGVLVACCGTEPREPSYSCADLLPAMEEREGSRAGLAELWAKITAQWEPLEPGLASSSLRPSPS